MFKKVYLCMPVGEEIYSDDVLVMSGYSVEEIEDDIAEKISKEANFREYVSDGSVNMSFAERFYHEDGKYMFDFHMDRCNLPAEWVIEKAGGMNLGLAYIHDAFKEQAFEFFGEQFADEYFAYLLGEEDKLSDDFYKYVAKHDKDWISYEIKEIGYASNEHIKKLENDMDSLMNEFVNNKLMGASK